MALHQQLPFFNPILPFSCPIQGGLLEGMSITVCGRVLPEANEFEVDLYHGSDLVLHFNPRYKGESGHVVHNTYQNDTWGDEEIKSQTPVPRGQLFALQILVMLGSYQGPVSERRLSENSEYVNPEIRETLGFQFQNGRFVKPGKAGIYSVFGCIDDKHIPTIAPLKMKLITVWNGRMPDGGINVNGKPFSEYKHRMPFSDVDQVYVKGMVELNLVAFQYLAPHLAARPGSFMVPYKSIIHGGVKPGKVIIIQGVISLQGPDNRMEIFLRYKTGIAFYYSPRFDEKVIVWNSYEDGKWSEQEQSRLVLFKRGEPMQVTICSSHLHYRVFVNGQQAHTYSHRYKKLEEIDVLEVSGDLQLSFVQA